MDERDNSGEHEERDRGQQVDPVRDLASPTSGPENGRRIEEEIADEAYALRFSCCVSARYCQALELHYRRLNTLSGLISVVGGAAVVADALTALETLIGFQVSVYAGAAVATASLSAVFFGWSDKAAMNKHAQQTYANAAARLRYAGETISRERLQELGQELENMSGVHEKTKDVLYLIGYNQECRSRGMPRQVVPLNWFQRLLTPWLDIGVNNPTKVEDRG